MSTSTQTLPDGYVQSGEINLKRSKRLALFLNITGFFTFVIIFALLSIFGAVVRSGTMNISGSISVGPMLILMGLTIFILLVHELIHGFFFWIFSRNRPVFALRLLYAYAGAPTWYFPNRQYAIITLAPLVIIGAVGLLLMLLVPVSWLLMITFLVALNTGGAIGDIFVFIRLLKCSPTGFANDTGDVVTFFERPLLTTSCQNIIRRLLYLRNLEFINIFFLPVCLYIAITSREVQHWQPYAYSMFMICVALAQGVFYWHLKIQTIHKNGIALPSYFHQIFSFFKWTNVLLLSIYPMLVFCSQITSLVNFQVSIWSNLLFLFAVLEYINYYHYQLSHDNLNDIRYLIKYKKIRRSPLSVDMKKNKKTRPDASDRLTSHVLGKGGLSHKRFLMIGESVPTADTLRDAPDEIDPYSKQV